MSAEKGHSHKGPSSAERWMNCGGSTILIERDGLPETDDPDYRAHGVAAHAAAAAALEHGFDGWELIGETFEGIKVDETIANSIQQYLDRCRPFTGPGFSSAIEHRIQLEEHPDGFGTLDFRSYEEETHTLRIKDYKDGVGIAVDVEWNVQLMYYAYAELQKFPDARWVELEIVQPRGFHPAGPVRTWLASVEWIVEWAQTELLPKMNARIMDLVPGEHCRFCPMKLTCPALAGMFAAVVRADVKEVLVMSDERLGQEYRYLKGVEMYAKALKDEAYRRSMLGTKVPFTKVVAKKADRVWKGDAGTILEARLGPLAYAPKELNSPAQMEKLGPEAKELVKEWAYTPQTGYTIALETDKRPAVEMGSRFTEAALALTQAGEAQ